MQARSQPSGGGGGRWRPKGGPSRVVCVCVWGEGITIVSGPGGGVVRTPPNPTWLRACVCMYVCVYMYAYIQARSQGGSGGSNDSPLDHSL